MGGVSNTYLFTKDIALTLLYTAKMTSLPRTLSVLPIKRTFGTTVRCTFKITDWGNNQSMPANVQEMGNSQKVVANMDRSREYSGQQTFARMFSPQFMSDQNSHISSDKGSLENTCGYDMDGNAQLASVVLTNLPEPFAAIDVDKLKEGIPEGLSDMAREHGQRWAMEDRMSNRFTYLN